MLDVQKGLILPSGLAQPFPKMPIKIMHSLSIETRGANNAIPYTPSPYLLDAVRRLKSLQENNVTYFTVRYISHADSPGAVAVAAQETARTESTVTPLRLSSQRALIVGSTYPSSSRLCSFPHGQVERQTACDVSRSDEQARRGWGRSADSEQVSVVEEGQAGAL